MSESSNDIVITCKCGQPYRVPAAYGSQTFTCPECGDTVQVPLAAPPSAVPIPPTAPAEAPRPAIDMRLDADAEVADPDAPMQEVRQSRLTRAILIGLVAHVLLVGLTSFGLYADWAKYGIMMPYAIKAEKKARAEAEQKRKAQAEADKKAAAAAANPAAQPEGGQTNQAAQAGAAATAPPATGAGTAPGPDQPAPQPAKSDYEKKVLEVSRDRPAQSPISGLDGDLDLDK